MSISIIPNTILIMEETLGQRLRRAREAKGWTLERAGIELGRPTSWLSNLEIGRTKGLPEPTELRKLGQIFEIPMTELMIASGYLQESDLGPTPNNDNRWLRDLFSKLRKVDWYQPGRGPILDRIVDGWLEDDRKQREGK